MQPVRVLSALLIVTLTQIGFGARVKIAKVTESHDTPDTLLGLKSHDHASFVQKTAAALKHQTLGLGVFEGWNIYQYSFVPLLLVTLVTAASTRPQIKDAGELTDAFKTHRLKYLAVWAVAVSADWLQGPFVYAVYASYGYSHRDINKLFVIGFLSSMVFGTVVGSLADTWGRKRMALLYCVLYIISCLTIHCNSFSALAVGRVTGGIATSLLFSTFECWMVSEHKERHQFSGGLLGYMFSMMYLVHYLVAVLSGITAQVFVNAVPMAKFQGSDSLYYGGNTCPYDLAIVMLCIGLPMICFLWDENYGDCAASQTILGSYKKAADALASSWKVSIIGFVLACFEGSMYAFVINWTPALSMEGAPSPPHGLIFSAMMMCCMLGSAIFSFCSTNPAKVLVTLCSIATVCFLAVSSVCGQAAYVPIIYFSFLCFEGCVGVYFPAMGALKSEAVVEEARAGVYNIYRVPLNIVVCAVILTDLSLQGAFAVCAALLGLATAMVGALVCSAPKPSA